MLSPYQKPTTTISQQITLLRKRGLVIPDEKIAEKYLTFVGYYRLAGYWQIYQSDKVNHIFHEGVTFRHITELYNFDRELRILLCDAIERIEIALRSIIVNTMCASHGPLWFTNPSLVEREDWYNENLSVINAELDRSMEEFIEHHDGKYGKEPHPPAWKTIQILSFGTLSKLYSNIKNNLPEKKAIARAVGLPNHLWLESWFVVFTVLRNYCAHHSRVCFRTFTFPPKDLHTTNLPWLKRLPAAGGRLREHLYYQLCAIRYVLHSIDPGNALTSKLKDLIKKYPSVSLRRMGFPADWDTEDLWTVE